MSTLVVDTGTGMIGVYSVEEGTYLAYMGDQRLTAVDRIRNADELITYNGTDHGQHWSDLRELARIAGCDQAALLRGKHTDMQEVCCGHLYWP